jgi:hypothetical protein
LLPLPFFFFSFVSALLLFWIDWLEFWEARSSPTVCGTLVSDAQQLGFQSVVLGCSGHDQLQISVPGFLFLTTAPSVNFYPITLPPQLSQQQRLQACPLALH